MDNSPMVITKSTAFEAGTVLRQPLVIAASHITVDGNGAMLVGPGEPGQRESYQGVGIRAAGCSGVTLRNFKVRGFESALTAVDGAGWLIENNDFSDNYTDLEFGWGEHPRVGGLILTRISGSVIRGNTAQRVWNALDLSECCDNLITGNRCSPCSNVCLKLDRSSRNTVIENDLSYGLRIKPGEVHARDSTGVLVESGSDHNYFYRNDITHGGDGVFIRVLNGWVSTGNVFVENDCSYANNNGFEAWAPGNTYIRNKANHCSYGFWLGGSDNTVVIGNEAAYAAPKPDWPKDREPEFGHGGIVIFGSSSSHALVENNYCHDNAGGGIVLGGAYHLVIQNNRLENNWWSLWARGVDFIDLAANECQGNQKPDALDQVQHLTARAADERVKLPPKALLTGPTQVRIGERVRFDGSASFDPQQRPLTFQWDAGGEWATTPVVERAFDKPGFYRVSLTVSNGVLSDLAYRDVYVVAEVAELGAEGGAASWKWSCVDKSGQPGRIEVTEGRDALVGQRCLEVRAAAAGGFVLTGSLALTPDAARPLSDERTLQFWLRVRNANVNELRAANPVVELRCRGGGALTYTPVRPNGRPANLLLRPPFSEARWGWQPVSVPLAGGAGWRRDATGDATPAEAEALVLRFEEPGSLPLAIWVDGMSLK